MKDVIKAKKQKKVFKIVLDVFYEEELNWWDKKMGKERNCRYGNENTALQAVGSTLTGVGQIRKEVHCAQKTIAFVIKTSKLTESVL